MAETQSGKGGSYAVALRFWRIWGHKHTSVLLLSLVSMLLVAATSGAYSYLIKWVYDSFEQGENVALFIMPIVIAITSVRGLAFYGQARLTNTAVLRSLKDIQEAMFSRLLTWDFQQITRNPAGTLATRFSNDMTILREALLRLTTGIRDVFQVIVLVGAMFYYDWVLSLLVLVIYPIVGGPIVRIGQRLRKTSADTQEHMGGMTSVLNESFSGARMVKTYQLEEHERQRASAQFQDLYELYLRIVKNRAQLDPIMEVVGGLAVGGVISVGGYRITSGATSGGDLVAFVVALVLAAPAVRAIATINNVLQEGFASLDRVFDLLDEEPRVIEAEDAKELLVSEGHVEFSAVQFAYVENEPVLRGLTFTVEPGQTVALVGPSGAGKSTVLNLLPRLYDLTSGHIKVDGQDIMDVTLESLRAPMALVSQDVILFNDTIRANIAFGRPDATEDEIIAAAKAAAAHDFIQDTPKGYDTKVGDRGLNLSGGQRQRISIARAMLRDPKILLLDEATSALDAESEARVQDALDRLREGRTTLVIAHRLATVQNADKIYVMDKGRVREEGTHTSLMSQKGLYANLAEMQFNTPQSQSKIETKIGTEVGL